MFAPGWEPKESKDDAIPQHVLNALRAYDEAKRAHLYDCWFQDDTDESRINDRYQAYKIAEADCHRAIEAWTGRHGHEFDERCRLQNPNAK